MKALIFDIEHSSGIFRPWLPGFVLSCIGYKFVDYVNNTEEEDVLWFDHKNISFDPPFYSESWELFQIFVDRADIIVGHNLKHDMIIARFCGNIDFGNKPLWDTMNTEYLLAGQNPERTYNLNDVLKFRNLEHKNLDINEYWDAGIKTEDIPWEVVKERVLSDIRLTEQLYLLQESEAYEGTLNDPPNKIIKIIKLQNEFQHSLTDMELNGLLIDRDEGLRIYLEEKKKVEQLEKELKEIFNCPELNLSSNDQLSAVLYGGEVEVSWKEWVTKPLKNKPETKYYEKKFSKKVVFPQLFLPLKKSKTKKDGVYKTDKTTILQLKAKNKIGRLVKSKIQELNEHTKILETLIGKKDSSGLLNKLAADGKLHTEFQTAFVSTGRLSSRNPNGQNFPRDGTSPIKRIIIPSLDYILQWDLSQIEWKVAGWLSQDLVMLLEIREGVDQHIAACKDIMKLRFINKDDPESKINRTYAKIFNFRMIYGGSFWGFFLDPKMPRFSKEEWKLIVEEFFKKYFRLKEWQDENIKYVWLNNGLMVLPTGRRFQFIKSEMVDGVPSYPENCIKNYPVQGMAGGDILPLACAIIRRGMRNLKLKSKLILTVHDSIVFDVAKNELKRLVILLEKITEQLSTYISNYFEIDFDIKLEGECEYGTNYGTLGRVRSVDL